MPKEVLRLSKNVWERFLYLQQPPSPCPLRQGDVCRVNKVGHRHHGKLVQVHFASGDRVEVRWRAELFNLKVEDLTWRRFSPVLGDR